MKKIKLTIIVVLCIFNNQVFSQDVFIPPDVVESPMPMRMIYGIIEHQKEWLDLNYSKDCNIEFKNDSLKISHSRDQKYLKTIEIEAFDGLFFSTYNGHFDRKLKYISNKNKDIEVEINTHNIVFLFQFNDKIYFIESNYDVVTRNKPVYSKTKSIMVGSQNASLCEIYMKNGAFFTKKVLDFDEKPLVMNIFNDKIFFASYSNFYAVENMKIKSKLEDIYWSGLYPNSIAVKNEENIFVGIRGGFVKIDLITRKINFYKYFPK
ncbi:hypothetical protein GV828_01415 [Flavobacterium sp. NST-5]|uniref:Uncharacterized protein n=1 Tax=Flavobacterium ichthyis TaxID=2698827 RepID=A0ABW9Z922_9FLAO|nr:hypothetical protein [Flavobacterium ichthyis]NBL63852.1 hypothetical protein [Flavobacterium ichthyis]